MSSPEEAARNIKDDEIVFKTGECRKVVKRMTGGDGKEYWFEAVKIPYRDSEGRIVGFVGIAKDITKIEEALRISMEKLNVKKSITISRERYCFKRGFAANRGREKEYKATSYN